MKKTVRTKPAGGQSHPSLAVDVEKVVAWLKRRGTKKIRDGMARFAIPSEKAFGISVGDLRTHAKRLRGTDAALNHDLAAALWKTGWYEARLLAAFVDEPALVTSAQMDLWSLDFDNWAICDTACFHLFDRTPHAWQKLKPWSRRQGEFARRAAFALLWSLSVHDKLASDEPFLRSLPLVERGASDERNFVKKAVNMALRAIGKRNAALHAAAIAAAQRLADSPEAAARWVGKDALRELTSDAVKKRLAARRPGTPRRSTRD